MPNLSYATLDFFKSRGALNIAGSTDDLRLRRLIEAVSVEFDGYTRRHFNSITATRYFAGNDKTRILFPDWDIVAITALKEDDNGDGTYNITWSSTDYELWPYDADPTAEVQRSSPYQAIEVNLRSNGSQDIFLKGQKRYEIAARFGYWEWLNDVGINLNSSMSATQTGINTSTSAAPSTKIEVGATIKMGSEQMYVTDRSTAIDGDITVIRGINGTTAAAHTNDTDIQVYIYPSPIVEATIEQTSRLWTRRGQGFANQIGFQETGQVGPVVTGLDRDIRDLIRPYIKMVA